ncbi:hypothetical protein [Azospirillum thermophilum]|uniref:Uncharacterized protein n=1 Tax=Azospirillum thermophilum TaxID=2202148 RepID=A0A2S2CUC9_9PROT|nr:hypothetical protein [Azospirillum thermophilum]AWK88124.1 hypothetical protein DEW08_18530 [Azospirillum thermophilum]
MIFNGPNRVIRLSQWAWLHVGASRRLIGWESEQGRWVASEPLSSVASSRPMQPPGWVVTADGAQIMLSNPGVPTDESALEAILETLDRLRYDPRAGIAASAAITIVPWLPTTATVLETRRIA